MSHTVSGKITRAPNIQTGSNNNGTYTAFFFEVSEFIKGYGQTENAYTNYSVAFFAKTQAAIDFYNKAVKEGNFVVVSCDKLKIDISNIDYPKLKMDNARLDNFFDAGTQPQQQAGYQQQAPVQQQAPQMAPQQQTYQQAPQQQAPAPQQQMQQQPMQQQAAPQQNIDEETPF